MTIDGQLVPVLFHWSQVEERDYRLYIANLRAIGCPEETIRDIIIAEVNRLYWPKLAALAKDEPNFWDCSRNPDAGRAGFGRKKREIDKEKRAFLKMLLGIDPEPELRQLAGAFDDLAGPVTHLEPEKRDQVRQILETYGDKEREVIRLSRGLITDEDTATIRQLQRLRRQELSQILTARELEDYEVRTSETAWRLQNNMLGFEPTEDEFRQVFRLQRAFDLEFGATSDMDPDDHMGFERRFKAEQDVKEQIQSLLGEKRYQDYQKSQDYSYRELVQIAERYGQPKEVADEVYSLKKSIHEQAQRINSDSGMSAEDRRALLQNVQGWTEGSVQAVLGPDAFKFYKKRGGQWMGQLVR